MTLAFAFHGPVLDQAIDERGDMPLPPYIASRRAADERDRADYQTVFAREDGSVAAPTAGLHFTAGAAGARWPRAASPLHSVTLHVGAGTFLPVKADDTAGHSMHAEWGEVPAEAADALNAARAQGRAHRRGRHDGAAAAGKRRAATDGTLAAFAGETAIFITPGYRFRAVDLLLTNFHLPRSTLFMLVAAFGGLDAHAARLCARDRGRLSLLFLWRCLPAVSCAPMSDASPSRCSAPTARARRGEIVTPHGTRRDAGLHAGRHRRHGEGADARRRCARPAPRSCSATPIT